MIRRSTSARGATILPPLQDGAPFLSVPGVKTQAESYYPLRRRHPGYGGQVGIKSDKRQRDGMMGW
jgi:hypothetical protein